jgi:hypothetical protein
MASPEVIARRTAILKTVAEGLKAQNGRSYDSTSGSCMYRHDGKKCAVGMLIPDDKYSPGIEKAAIYSVMYGSSSPEAVALDSTLNACGFLPEDYQFLSDLQKVHDRSDVHQEDWWTFIFRGLISVAVDYGLDTRVIPD